MRKQIAAANWKMNLTLQQGSDLIDLLLKEKIGLKDYQEVILAVPFPYLIHAKDIIEKNKNYFIAAQNIHFQKAGAYTGEVSAEIIKSTGIRYVIIGHSERREYFNENHQMLAEKINLSLANDLKPIFCCGEPLSVREADAQNAHVKQQLEESLFHLTEDKIKNFIIAYEPVWAIGTGKTATAEQAQEMHGYIRNEVAKKYNNGIADTISILYGGSVKANNAKEIFGKPDVDGGLVGGASLIASEFTTIIKSLK